MYREGLDGRVWEYILDHLRPPGAECLGCVL